LSSTSALALDGRGRYSTRPSCGRLLPSALEGGDRGAAVAAMGEAFQSFLAEFAAFDAILGIGSGGGISIVTRGMRTLLIGLPKMMVSTLASGDVGPYVDVSDIVMMPSITDLAGLNSAPTIANA
jgi:uncharacterized protein (UPF0261 family)